MKLIDLLNKLANGEKTPRQVAYYGVTYTYDGTCYVSDECELLIDHIEDLTRCLNKEVEIIEEDKKIEKLNDYFIGEIWFNEIGQERLDNNFNKFAKKINELIDEVNKFNNKG